jgi:hypothetical protein
MQAFPCLQSEIPCFVCSGNFGRNVLILLVDSVPGSVGKTQNLHNSLQISLFAHA